MVRSHSKKGFTLIELLVVVIIVAVLAAVGIPLLTGNVARARASEAEAGLGAIRTAARAFSSEHGTYQNATLTNIGLKIDVTQGVGDLDGRFFGDGAYALAVTGGGTGFCATVDGAAATNEAIKKNLVDGSGGSTVLKRSMDQLGTIRDDATACGGNILND